MNTTAAIRREDPANAAGRASGHGLCNRRIRQGVLAAIAALMSAASHGQTCAAPEQLILFSDGPPGFYTTCGTETSFLTLCNGAVTTNAPSHVFNVFINPGNTLVLTLTGSSGPGFTPIMYFIGGAACDAGDCSASATTLSLHDESPGQHQLIVTGSPQDPDGNCGNFSLSLTGDVGDEIFTDGFDQDTAG